MYKYRYSVSIKLFSIMGFLATAAAMLTGKKWENFSQIYLEIIVIGCKVVDVNYPALNFLFRQSL